MHVRIQTFYGLNTRADGKRGPFCSALTAKNCDFREGLLGTTLTINTGGALALFPTSYSASVKKIHLLTASQVLQWLAEVTVAKYPTGPSSDYRVVYTGEDVPKVTDLTLATCASGSYAAPAKMFVLGIPVPGDIGYLSVSGATVTGVDRAYVYTYVNAWGEESAPCAPGLITADKATVLLNRLGVTSRHYTSNPYAQDGIPCDVTFVGTPVPGYMQFNLTGGILNYAHDVRAGDRVFLSHNTAPGLGNQSYLASAVSSGSAYVRVQANCWPPQAQTSQRLYRVGPINQFNVIQVSPNVPASGKCTVYLDTIEGLRVSEKLTFSGAAGMTDLNATFTIEAFSTGADVPCFPGVVIALSTAQTHTVGTGVGKRTAPHNTAETRITNITHSGGLATVTVESTAHIEAGDEELIRGVLGAYEANGVRRVVAVTPPSTFTFSLATMSAYSGGGAVMLNIPYAFDVWEVTAVAAATGGPYPTAFLTNIDLKGAHNLEVGEMVLAYELGGAVEMNTELVVSAVRAAGITVSMASSHTAWTSGGKIARIEVGPRKRIYRTVTGEAAAEYQLVDEISADRCRYSDSKADASLGAILETDGYIQPPTDLHSVVAHPNGFLQGLSGNKLCQTPAFRPWAWPTALQRDIPAEALALNITDITTVALTSERPYLFTGLEPTSLRRTREDNAEPYNATGLRGHTSAKGGVLYKGRTGIWLVGGGPARNVTQGLLPASTFATQWRTQIAHHEGRIYWIDGDLTDAAIATGYVIDPAAGERGLSQLEAPFEIYDFEEAFGNLYVAYLDSTMKYAKFADFGSSPTARFTWHSQYIRLPKPVSLTALQVEFDWKLQSATLQAREDNYISNLRTGGSLTVVNPDTTLIVPAESYIKVKVIANPDSTSDQETIFDDYVVNDRPVRMAGRGVAADVYQVQIIGSIPVSAVTIAETIEELEEA